MGANGSSINRLRTNLHSGQWYIPQLTMSTLSMYVIIHAVYSFHMVVELTYRWNVPRSERRRLLRSIMPKLGELPVIRMSLSLLPQECILISSMLLIMFLMYTTAHHAIRKQCFEAFWYTHHLVPPFPSLSTSKAK